MEGGKKEEVKQKFDILKTKTTEIVSGMVFSG